MTDIRCARADAGSVTCTLPAGHDGYCEVVEAYDAPRPAATPADRARVGKQLQRAAKRREGRKPRRKR